MQRRRSLSREEAALWAAVAKTVRPIERGEVLMAPSPGPSPEGEGNSAAPRHQKPLPFRGGVGVGPVPVSKPAPRQSAGFTANTLDSSWDKKLAKAVLSPDFTLDLHGHSLSAAHTRLEQGLAQAALMDARLVLVITGRPRPAEAADRGERRGAIRAKVLDWLALGPHASRIAAVRPAHRRHGGAGALYVVLRRPK